jgi:hypothetical protein
MAFFQQQPPAYDDAQTTLTPYLTLPHLLSLTWLAYPIISLIFVAFRLQASLDSTQNAILGAKDDLLASCKAAEEAATAAASMPRYMAIATNEQFADAVNASLRGARQALVLSLTVMEAVINFIIDLYRSIFLCFLELVVRGGLAILIGAVDEVSACCLCGDVPLTILSSSTKQFKPSPAVSATASRLQSEASSTASGQPSRVSTMRCLSAWAKLRSRISRFPTLTV